MLETCKFQTPKGHTKLISFAGNKESFVLKRDFMNRSVRDRWVIPK